MLISDWLRKVWCHRTGMRKDRPQAGQALAGDSFEVTRTGDTLPR